MDKTLFTYGNLFSEEAVVSRVIQHGSRLIFQPDPENINPAACPGLWHWSAALPLSFTLKTIV
jgi:hypothetical protein